MPAIPYGHANKITPGTSVAPGRGVVVSCSNPGKVGLLMADGSLLQIYAPVGTMVIDDISVSGVSAAATTAIADVSVVS